MRQSFEDKLIEIVKAIVVDGRSEAECRGPVDGMTPEERDALLALARSHQMGHIVEYALQTVGEMDSAVSFFTSVAVTMQQVDAVRAISSALSREGIAHMLLKGTVMRGMYPAEWMRNSCDIDVLVAREDLERAGAVLVGMGYEQQGIVTVHDVGYIQENVRVELHYLLIEDYRMSPAAEVLGRVWDTAVRSGDGFSYAMPDEMFYFYHIAHMAKHFGDGGCGLRSFVDLWLLNHRCDFNREAREKLLLAGGVLSFEEKARQLSDYWFSDGSGEGLEFIEKYVLSGGAYGSTRAAEEVRMHRRGRVKYLFDRIFMPYSQLKKRYPSLDGKPYLLPFYEVVRWCSVLGKNRKKYVTELKADVIRTERTVEIEKMISDLGLDNFI